MKIAVYPRSAAMKDPANFAFIPDIGYARPTKPLPKGPVKDGNCAAPFPPEDGSRHLIKPPGNHEALFATWHAKSGVWLFVGGRRLGFTPDYLASHGWTYLRAAPLGTVYAAGERRH